MKKLFKLTLVLTIMLTSFQLSAQDSFRGSMIIGGSSNLNFSYFESELKSDDFNEDLGKTTNLELAPLVGWFVNDNTILGFQLPLEITSNENANGDKVKSKSLALGPFLRQYLSPGTIRPFLQVGIGIGKTKQEITYSSYWNSDDENNFNIFTYDIGGGLSVFLNQNIALDFQVSYGKISAKLDEDDNDNLKTITEGTVAEVGFMIIF